MIVIDDGDNIVGSKRFTDAVAEALRPLFNKILNEEELEDFEGEMLCLTTICFNYCSAERFMAIVHFLEQNPIKEFEYEYSILINAMKKDPRYSEDN